MDPLFVDIADGNFRLRPPSPCVNTGNNALVVSSNGEDLDIQPRISGGRVDMGAYEFQAGAFPVIVTQPLSQSVYSGGNVTFSAAAEGAQPLSWQWRFNGNAIPGQTNPTLTFVNVTTNQNGSYSVVVTNFSGSDTSQSAVLTVVDAAPSITKQPLSQSVPPGNSITLSADAVGSLPMFWQWLFNGSAVPDATKSSLNVGPVASDQAGTYSVVVTNAFGKAVSSDAIVSLGPATGVTYVWQDSPNPTLPYTNWLTAAHSIPDAVSAAGANYQVIVTNGTYPGTVTIDKPLTLLSVNGPQVTVIDAGWNMGPAFDSGSVTMTDGASVSGFTITNGQGGANGVGVWCR
ncbi:MAG TPA: immunoglobulin domain-containing protein, partial [Candidatus Dormibacteraeota bacterium]|nr:immunoglobulin domain-containing protein [Candidatus Dormibacteraeota bacterium]